MSEEWESLYSRVFLELPEGLPGRGGEGQIGSMRGGSQIAPVLQSE